MLNENWMALIGKMGRIRCKTHGASGIAHVSVDIAAGMKAGGRKLDVLRYDIDCLEDGSASISYFVSRSVAKEFEMPTPDLELFDSKFENRYDAVFDRLTTVCAKCFAEHLKKTN